MIKPKVFVHEVDGKFGLFIEGRCIGYSKTDCDARFHLHHILNVFDAIYKDAYDAGEEHGRTEEANDPTVAPICPRCHTQRLRCANGCTWEITDKPTRNQEALESFAAFCQANPSMRFWQALLCWSGQGHILFSHFPSHMIKDNVGLEDTFSREGK